MTLIEACKIAKPLIPNTLGSWQVKRLPWASYDYAVVLDFHNYHRVYFIKETFSREEAEEYSQRNNQLLRFDMFEGYAVYEHRSNSNKGHYIALRKELKENPFTN